MKLSVKAQITLVVLLSVLIVPFLYIVLFSHASADDYDICRYTSTQNVFERLSYNYMNWSGRFSSVLMEFSTIDTVLYRIVVESYILIFPISVFWIFSSLFPLSFLNNTLYSLGFTAVIYSGMPAIGESLYWITGLRTYLFGVIIMFFYFGILFRIQQKGVGIGYSLKSILLYLLVFILGGINEPLSIIVCVFHFLFVFYYKEYKKFSGLNFVLILSVIISFIAPGNYYRHSIISMPSLEYLIFDACVNTITFMFEWLIQPMVLFGIASAFLLGIVSLQKRVLFPINFKVTLLFFSTLTIVVASGVFFFGFWNWWNRQTTNVGTFFY